MEEYIGKNQLKRELHSLFKYESFPIADIEKLIDCLPVMPRRGRWIWKDHYLVCSECGKENDRTNYCSNCGARMDGKVNV